MTTMSEKTVYELMHCLGFCVSESQYPEGLEDFYAEVERVFPAVWAKFKSHVEH